MLYRGLVRRSLQDHEFPALDGLRALAVGLVLLIHFSYLAHVTIGNRTGVHRFLRLVAPVADLGGTGVHLFFVLSGGLLFLPFARHLLGGGKAPAIRSFYARRARRILPAYYAALLLTIVVFGDAAVAAAPIKQLLSHLLLLHDYSAQTLGGIDGPTWTLSIEGQFYLMLPLIAAGAVALARRGRITLIAGACILLLISPASAVFTVALKHAFGRHDYTAVDAVSFLSVFGAGIVAACIYTALEQGVIAPAKRNMIARCGIVTFVLIFGGYVVQNIVSMSSAALSYYGFGLLFGLCYAGLFLYVLLRESPIRRFLSRPTCRFIGQISYSIYLVHYPLLQHVVMPFAARVDSSLALLTAIVASVVIVVPVACMMHFAIERPFIRRASVRPERAIVTST